MEKIKPYKRTDTTHLFDQLNIILYLTGYTNFWVQKVNLPKKFTKFYDYMNIVLHILCIAFSIIEFGSLFTQNELTIKQQADRNVIAISNPIMHVYSIKYFLKRKETREMFYYIAVLLKEVHNDLDVERSMIRKLKAYLIAYAGSSFVALTLYGVYSTVKYITEDAPFITVITMWPVIHDRSKLAEMARVVFYLFWWISFYRDSAFYLLILSMLIGLSHQYMNLQSYFYNLQRIFDDSKMSQKEKEDKYVESFKYGIKLHTSTIWCTNQCQLICSEIYASQVLLLTIILINFLPALVNSQEDMELACAHFPSFIFTLVIMGYVMWNAGDITVEAAKLPDAMYSSGWENCYDQSAVRVRKLIVIAMTQAQQPIVLTAFGVVELSYETYLAILKSAYSVVSVFY
uniref:Odorant receptor n=1 Tax=Dendrolimus houi TaxID=765132 RepID=A0A076E7L0_9NEOP|nr:odorant receptor [Dendrolimus houi]